MDELKEQICEILFKRSEYTRISEIDGLHQLHERQFDNVSEDILSLLEQRQEPCPHETVVNRTINVVICNHCKSYWVGEIEKCECGCKTFTKTHKSNAQYAINLE